MDCYSCTRLVHWKRYPFTNVYRGIFICIRQEVTRRLSCFLGSKVAPSLKPEERLFRPEESLQSRPSGFKDHRRWKSPSSYLEGSGTRIYELVTRTQKYMYIYVPVDHAVRTMECFPLGPESSSSSIQYSMYDNTWREATDWFLRSTLLGMAARVCSGSSEHFEILHATNFAGFQPLKLSVLL